MCVKFDRAVIECNDQQLCQSFTISRKLMLDHLANNIERENKEFSALSDDAADKKKSRIDMDHTHTHRLEI